MKARGYVKSSPHFFRLIKASMAVAAAFLLALAALVPAPLQEQANMAQVPNPVKSAWFLLWIQELVSYSKYLIYAVLLSGLLLLLLPWLSPQAPEKGAWFPRERRKTAACSLLVFLTVIALTVVAMFFRGANWQFVPSF